MIEVDNLYVFCISLQSREDKRHTILNNYPLFNIIFFDAIDTRDEKWKNYKHIMNERSSEMLSYNVYRGFRNFHHELTPGAVGCFLSHLNLCQYIVNNQLKYNLVLEDDSQPLIPDFKDFLKMIFKDVPEDADIVLFHYIIPYSRKKNKVNKNIFSLQQNQFQFWCLDTYLLTLNGAKKILKNFDKIEMQYDSFLSKLYRQGKINIYFSTHQFVKQVNKSSDIQTLGKVLYPTDFNF